MAKSPTPIPAPPVKIHRGAPGSAPARQRRRKKKVNPFVLFLRGLARRLYFGIKTAFKFLLFVPVLVFMVAFSYNVDRSGLFQGELAPRRIVDLMLQGYDVSNFEQMNEIEREVVQLFVKQPNTREARDKKKKVSVTGALYWSRMLRFIEVPPSLLDIISIAH